MFAETVNQQEESPLAGSLGNFSAALFKDPPRIPLLPPLPPGDARTDGGRRDADVPLQPAGGKDEKRAAGCEARPAAALTEPSVNQQQQQLRWLHMEEPGGRC